MLISIFMLVGLMSRVAQSNGKIPTLAMHRQAFEEYVTKYDLKVSKIYCYNKIEYRNNQAFVQIALCNANPHLFI
jgi:hypothetical protein